MEKLIYRGHELDERIWLRIKNDLLFKKMFDDCLDDLYQPERSKREDSYFCEFGCSIPVRFNTSEGIKTMIPGKIYDNNLNEI